MPGTSTVYHRASTTLLFPYGAVITGGEVRLTGTEGTSGEFVLPFGADGRVTYDVPRGRYRSCTRWWNAAGSSACIGGDRVLEVLWPHYLVLPLPRVLADGADHALAVRGSFDGPGENTSGWRVTGPPGITIRDVHTGNADLELRFTVNVPFLTPPGQYSLTFTSWDDRAMPCHRCLVIDPGPVPPPIRGSTPIGYRMLEANGTVHGFGGANSDVSGVPWSPVAIASSGGAGYWLLLVDGTVVARGAPHHGNADVSRLPAGEQVSSMAGLPDGTGYWVFTNRGRAFAFGRAASYGDMTGVSLNGPVVASVPTTTGDGYWMIGSDGGVFAFGDARFHGSMGGRALNEPVVGIVPDPDGVGYWLVAADGGIFAFDAPFRGSVPGVLAPGQRLNKPVIGAVQYGRGYLMVGSDGGIFDFSGEAAFYGSLGSNPPRTRIIGVAPMARP